MTEEDDDGNELAEVGPVDDDDDELDDELDDEVDVLVGAGPAEESGDVPASASSSAAVASNPSVLATSMYAHAGTVMLVGILSGKLATETSPGVQ